MAQFIAVSRANFNEYINRKATETMTRIGNGSSMKTVIQSIISSNLKHRIFFEFNNCQDNIFTEINSSITSGYCELYHDSNLWTNHPYFTLHIGYEVYFGQMNAASWTIEAWYKTIRDKDALTLEEIAASTSLKDYQVPKASAFSIKTYDYTKFVAQTGVTVHNTTHATVCGGVAFVYLRFTTSSTVTANQLCVKFPFKVAGNIIDTTLAFHNPFNKTSQLGFFVVSHNGEYIAQSTTSSASTEYEGYVSFPVR